MIDAIKCLAVINEAYVDFFSVFQLSLHYPPHVSNVISCSSCFPESCLIVWKFSFNCVLHSLVYYFKQCVILKLLSCISFLNIGIKVDPFQSSGHFFQFSICYCIFLLLSLSSHLPLLLSVLWVSRPYLEL